jgi:hypothetical protein
MKGLLMLILLFISLVFLSSNSLVQVHQEGGAELNLEAMRRGAAKADGELADSLFGNIVINFKFWEPKWPGWKFIDLLRESWYFG